MEPGKAVGALTIALFAAFYGAVGADSKELRAGRVYTAPDVGYSVEHWTVEEGLPGRIITSLAQTPDGALWCGSPDGLARFDGTRFTRIDPEQTPALRGVRILELRCDSHGRLWIGGIEGELIVLEKGQFRRLTDQDGLPPNQAGKFGESLAGVFWVQGRTNHQFYRYEDKRFHPIHYPGVPSLTIDRFLADASGVLWGVQERDRTMIRFEGSETKAHPLSAPEGQSKVPAGRLFRLRDGRWAVNSTSGIYALDGPRWSLVHAFTATLPSFDVNPVLDGVEDGAGNFWVSVFDLGLVVSGPGQPTSRVLLPDSSAKPFIRALIVGVEGNIWVAGNDGLYRLRRLPFRSQPRDQGSPHQAVVGFVEGADGTVWILRRDGWMRSTPEGWQSTDNPNPQAYLWAGCRSHDNSVILAFTEDGNSDRAYADRFNPDGRIERLGTLEGIVRVVFESKSGEVWAGTEAGLWQWTGERFRRVELPQRSGNFPVRGLAEDRQGRLVASVFGDGLWRREADGHWRRLTGSGDTASGEIWGLDIDSQDTIWVATASGLARSKQDSWQFFGTRHGDFPRLARSVVGDNEGGLWIASQFGVVRVDQEALDAAWPEQTVLGSDWFDRSDGLPSVSCSDEQGALHLAADGRIWVGTLNGAAVVDPREWQASRRLSRGPSVAITEVVVDDQSTRLSVSRTGLSQAVETVVPAGANRVEFRYEVVDLTPNPRTRLRYRLEGIDTEWRDVGEERRATYHQLPPSSYSFQVMAANKYGQWTNPGASVPILVQPRFWQTTWFQAGAGLAVLGVVWMTRLVTLRQGQRERLRREEFSRGLIQSQEIERKRIARELHDSLGQDLILIRNAAKLTLRKFDPSPQVGEHLNQVAELASHALDNARAITSNLRPPELDRLGLTAALEVMVEKHSLHSEIKLTATLENLDGRWSADQEIHVYRLIQESLNNALKHAHPRHIHLSATVQGSEANIAVQDDGRGFDPEQLSPHRAGIGLTGLSERVRILGGVMELSSAPGKGTLFRCRIPIPAYGQERGDSSPSRG